MMDKQYLDQRQKSIQRQVCLKCAVEILTAAISKPGTKLLEMALLKGAITDLASYMEDWLNDKHA